MTWQRVASLDVLLDRKLLFHFSRYGLAGAAAATTHLSVLVILAEVAVGMIVPLNYMLNRCFTFVDGTAAPPC